MNPSASCPSPGRRPGLDCESPRRWEFNPPSKVIASRSIVYANPAPDFSGVLAAGIPLRAPSSRRKISYCGTPRFLTGCAAQIGLRVPS